MLTEKNILFGPANSQKSSLRWFTKSRPGKIRQIGNLKKVWRRQILILLVKFGRQSLNMKLVQKPCGTGRLLFERLLNQLMVWRKPQTLLSLCDNMINQHQHTSWTTFTFRGVTFYFIHHSSFTCKFSNWRWLKHWIKPKRQTEDFVNLWLNHPMCSVQQ